MAALTATSLGASGAQDVNENTMTASDTMTYVEGGILFLDNQTGGALTVTITGADASATHPVQGVGSVDLSSGYSTGSIAAGSVKAIRLDTIKEYLKGTITLTGGTGIVASILNP